GLWVTDAAPERIRVKARARPKDAGHGVALRGKRGRRELIDFSTLMTFQLRVGVPLVRALEVAMQDCKNPQFANVLHGLQSHIESGLQLHEAMVYYPKVFSEHIISVVKAGETSSKLPEIFNDLKDYLEWVEQIVNDVRQASLYPAIVMVVISGF